MTIREFLNVALYWSRFYSRELIALGIVLALEGVCLCGVKRVKRA